MLTDRTPDLVCDRSNAGKELLNAEEISANSDSVSLPNDTSSGDCANSTDWVGRLCFHFLPMCVFLRGSVYIFLPAFIKTVPWSVYLQSTRKMDSFFISMGPPCLKTNFLWIWLPGTAQKGSVMVGLLIGAS